MVRLMGVKSAVMMMVVMVIMMVLCMSLFDFVFQKRKALFAKHAVILLNFNENQIRALVDRLSLLRLLEQIGSQDRGMVDSVSSSVCPELGHRALIKCRHRPILTTLFRHPFKILGR